RKTWRSTCEWERGSTNPTPTGSPVWAPPSAGEARFSSVALSRLQDDQLAGDAEVAERLAQHLRRAGEGRERSPVDGNHLARTEEPAGAGGLLGIHGVVVADGQESQLGTVHLAEQLHVGEESRVPRVVEGEAAGEPHDVTRRHAAVEGLVAIAQAAGGVGADHGDHHAQHLLAAPQVHAGAVLHTLPGQPVADLVIRHDDLRLILLGDLYRIPHVVAV